MRTTSRRTTTTVPKTTLRQVQVVAETPKPTTTPRPTTTTTKPAVPTQEVINRYWTDQPTEYKTSWLNNRGHEIETVEKATELQDEGPKSDDDCYDFYFYDDGGAELTVDECLKLVI